MPDGSGRILRMHDLVGSRVVDADGRKVGRVVDLEVEHVADFEVVALELGRYGPLDRVPLLAVVARIAGGHRPRTVPWSSVAAVDGGVIRLVRRAPPPGEERAEPAGPADERRPRTPVRAERKDRRSNG